VDRAQGRKGDNPGISHCNWVHWFRRRLERLTRRPRPLAEQTPEPAGEEHLPHTSGMILIIEVGGWTHGALPLLLGQIGYQAQVVRGREIALDALQHGHPTLVIVGGAADPKLYRALRRASSVPILALVPRPDEERVLTAFEAGVDDCQAGPISNSEVTARVRAIVRRIGQSSAPAKGPLS